MKSQYGVVVVDWIDHPLIFSSLENLDTWHKKIEAGDVKGFFGHEPSTQTINKVKVYLADRADKAVKGWISDRKFLFHLLFSVLAFLVSFYLLGYFVHDPLPFVDELIISTIIAVVLFNKLKKRDYQHADAIRKKAQLSNGIDNIEFIESESISEIDNYIKSIGELNHSAILAILENSKLHSFNHFDSSLMRTITFGLIEHLGKKRVKSADKMYKKGNCKDIIKLFKEDSSLYILYLISLDNITL